MQLPKGYIIIKEDELLLLHQQMLEMQRQIEELKNRLNKDSSNSHKPPSSDGLKRKVHNNRKKSNKKQGAQKGHEGKTLLMTEAPDKIVNHKVEGYCPCGKNLKRVEVLNIQRRQVIDLAEKLSEITEHQIEVKQCACGLVHRGEEGQFVPMQYGNKVKGFAVYLNNYQYIPFNRQQELFSDCFDINISDGVLLNTNKKCFNYLEEPEQQIKDAILKSPVIHNDETGIRCESKTKWIHTNSTEMFTYYAIHEKRGREAIDDIGILPDYKGISVHDRYSSYDDYECKHALCNAHLLRDLKGLLEEECKIWAEKMISFLVKAKQEKEAHKINKKRREELLLEYNKILKKGFKDEPQLEHNTVKKRGRPKKPKSILLLETFQNRSTEILRFLFHKNVPFDNNLAERDLRMVKLKQKISGCFRTKFGSQIFCRIRSYISTVRKQGYSVLEALMLAVEGSPINFSI